MPEVYNLSCRMQALLARGMTDLVVAEWARSLAVCCYADMLALYCGALKAFQLILQNKRIDTLKNALRHCLSLSVCCKGKKLACNELCVPLTSTAVHA